MNNKILKGCLVTIIVIVVLSLCLFGFGSYKIYEYSSSQNKMVEELIGNKLPPGLNAIFSMDLKEDKSQFRKIIMLLDFAKGSLIIIMNGPPCKTNEERTVAIESLKREFSLRKGSPKEFSQPFDLNVNGKNYTAFRVQDNRNPLDPKKLIMVLMNNNKRSLAVAYGAKESVYDENDFLAFVRLIKN